MSWRIHTGDALGVLKTLPSDSVHCCVTSPPYWGLRDYGVEPSIWGGISTCQHDWVNQRYYTEQTAAKCSSDAFSEAGEANAARLKEGRWRDNCWCLNCDAWRGCFGLEPTPEMFAEHAVLIFREVRRVLRNDGVLWLNIGDSYCSGNRGGYDRSRVGVAKNLGGTASDFRAAPNRMPLPGLKDKDLVGIPWLLAFALRSDGWYLRQDIIWSKPNPMPESVTDRCTKAHEYLFLLSKSSRYYYDAEAISEDCIAGDNGSSYQSEYDIETKPNLGSGKRTIKIPGGWDRGEGAHGTIHRNGRTSAEYQQAFVSDKRNRRSVWEIATSPFPEAHFATFPPKLIEPCILAGCPEGGTVLDPFCGAGTTGLVATRFQRNFIGIELNPKYVAMAERRIRSDQPLFNEVHA